MSVNQAQVHILPVAFVAIKTVTTLNAFSVRFIDVFTKVVKCSYD